MSKPQVGSGGSRIVRTSAVLTCAAMLALGQAARSETQGRRKAPEVAAGGLTVAEQVARQVALHAELSAQTPAGAENAPLRIEISQQDRESLQQPANIGFEPLKVGVVKPVPVAVGKPVGQNFTQGVIDQAADGGFVWAMTVTSPDAQAIRVHFTNFSLPDNTELFLLGTNGQAHGPYVGTGRNGNGEFWTRSILGDTGIIQLRYTGQNPNADRPKISFVVSDVGHIRGRRPPRVSTQSHDDWPCSDNATCMVDVNCVNTGPAGPAEDAVAKMEWIQGQFINTCTGGLLADTDSGSQIPYFLTANHCLTSSLSNMETFFNYTTDSCNGGCPDSLVTGGTPPPASTVGYTVLRTSSSSDYTLGTLDEAPPAGAVFLGWNSNPIANSNGANLFRISNANFGPQVYSEHSVDTGSPTCTGVPRGDWIYSQDTTGGTMGGSSGSPVVNSTGEVVGQLTGCCGFNCGDPCDSGNNWTIDGAFAAYFADVDDLLDPDTGCSSDPECDDGLFCTGTETCVGGSCQSSGDPCTGGDVCNESTDTCDTPVCDNNGTCDTGEDCNNCPNDCISGGGGTSCGDGTCNGDEDCLSCPGDCNGKQNGNPNGRFCCNADGGNDGQNPVNCNDSRCTSSGFQCGGGGGTDPFCCGDGTCEGDEDSGNCAVDCGGGCSTNGDCDDGDACTTDVCSGGVCSNTPIDCDDGDPCTSDSCSGGTCVNDPISPCCGDGSCDGGEDQCSCAADCGSPPASESNCSDGNDEDCDGDTDCSDSDCNGDPSCPSCGGHGSSCSSDADCCSNKCRGGACRGN